MEERNCRCGIAFRGPHIFRIKKGRQKAPFFDKKPRKLENKYNVDSYILSYQP